MSSDRTDNDASKCVDDRSAASSSRRNIGILSVATYFPKTYVSQEDLEVFDKVDSGKYTKGLMQDKMGFCTDLEDINSISLTVTKQLIEVSGVSLKDIGYLEVGTETIVDKSKSVKTCLMELFESSGNTDIEGVDTTNACYGGTAALFHAIDHCSSPYWDGRLAIVVAADIAVYDKGAARPTGGCGAVAMLIGPNAPLVIDSIRATHMTHTYDFYKPDPHSEYPTVDGKLSLKAYISAVDKCYQAYRQKFLATRKDLESSQVSLMENFDAILFHSPYCKLVRKAFARLLFNEYDILSKAGDETKFDEHEIFKGYKDLLVTLGDLGFPEANLKMDYDHWMKPIDKTSLEKVSIQLSEKYFQEKTSDSLYLANQVGNMYTASLYSCLAAFLTSKPAEQLVNNNILLFSYGSGSAASIFSAKLSHDVQAIRKLLSGICDIRKKLEERVKCTPEEFTAHLEHRKRTFHLPNRSPSGQPTESDIKSIPNVSLNSHLYPGTYYLVSVDEMYRRKYTSFEPIIENNNNEESNCVLDKSHQKGYIIEGQQVNQQSVTTA